MNLFPIQVSQADYYLNGSSGNAFAIIATVSATIKQYLRLCGAESNEIRAVIDLYMEEAMSSDYEHLLKVSKEYVSFNYIRD